VTTSATAVSLSTIEHDAPFVANTAELLPDVSVAMTPSTAMPMREGSRDGPGGCLMCSGPLASTRARYCTRACQQRSYRLRHQTPTTDLTSVRKALQRRKALVAHTIYECGGCGERVLRATLRRLQRVCSCPRRGRSVPGMRYPGAPRGPARRGGGSHHVNPQRRANRRGHAALLAQNLENPFGVYHMAHPGVATTTASSFHVFNHIPSPEDGGCLS
jgi:hypothetical protein